MSSTTMNGYWRVPKKMKAYAFWGHVHLDLRDAEFEAPEVAITTKAMMGGLTVTVPHGVLVEMRGSVLMGGALNKATDRPADATQLVRIVARGFWGGVLVRRPGRGDHRDLVEEAREQASEITRAAVESAKAHMHTQFGKRQGPSFGLGGRSNRDAGRSDRNPRIPQGTLTMLVSDIVGSTSMGEKLGDQRWLQVLKTHNSVIRERVADHGGVEVKSQGDGFIFVFPSARSAVLAAVDIQRAMASFRAEHPDTPVEVRVGVHSGEVETSDDDVFGQNVVVACRIADQAKAGQIVASGVTRDLAVSASDLGFDMGTEVELRGLSQPWRIHQVRWSSDASRSRS